MYLKIEDNPDQFISLYHSVKNKIESSDVFSTCYEKDNYAPRCKCLLEHYRVMMQIVDFEKHKKMPNDAIAYIISIPKFDLYSNHDYVLFINRNYTGEFDDDKFQNQVIRESFLHELAHVMLNHPFYKSGYIHRSNIFKRKRKYSNGKFLEHEKEAEIAAACLLMPEKKFKDELYNTDYDFSHVSKCFGVNIDCCAKWWLIVDNLRGHYIKIKYNENTPFVADFYIPQESEYDSLRKNMKGFYTKGDFESTSTLLSEVVNNSDPDCFIERDGDIYYCRVYAEDVRLVCVGTPRSNKFMKRTVVS